MDNKTPKAIRSRKLGPALPAIAVLAALLAVGLFAVVADRPCPLSAQPPSSAALSSPASLVPSGASPVPVGPRNSGEMEEATMAKPDQLRGKADREAVDKLIAEQKFEAAAAECARIREDARKRGDTTLWTWALIREGQLRTSLHGYETAVRFFKDEPWPDSPLERDMLDLFFANSLVTYYQAYSWEINRRERVEAKGPIDLKSWTRDQIFDEAWQALLRVWRDRDRLAGHKAAEFPDFWSPGDYPAGVRDTLRDGLVYLLARLLSDTTFWTPRQSNETWLLDLPGLLAEGRKDERRRRRRRSSNRPRPTPSRRRPPSSASTNPGAGAPIVPRPRSRPASSSSRRFTRPSTARTTGPSSASTSPATSPRTARTPGGRRDRPCSPNTRGPRTPPTPSSGPAGSPSKASSASPIPRAASVAATSSSRSKRPTIPSKPCASTRPGAAPCASPTGTSTGSTSAPTPSTSRPSSSRRRTTPSSRRGATPEKIVEDAAGGRRVDGRAGQDLGLPRSPHLREPARDARPGPLSRRRVGPGGFRRDRQQDDRAQRRRRRSRPRQARGRRHGPRREGRRCRRRRGPGPLRRHGTPSRRSPGRPLRLRLAEGPHQDRDRS